MQPLGYTTSKMSLAFLMSALRRIRADERSFEPVDLNLEAPPCAVLCCIALEAFANEVSSLTSAFLFQEKSDRPSRQSTTAQQQENASSSDTLQRVAAIRRNPHGSFYERYKFLLRELKIDNPKRLEELSNLDKLRNAFVHFRECDVPIVEDQEGIIHSAQDLPEVLAQLQSRQYNGRPVVAADGSEWTLRLSTNAMAAWSVSLALDAIMHVLDQLPAGKHRDFVWKAYASLDPSFSTVFEFVRSDLITWWNGLVSGTS